MQVLRINVQYDGMLSKELSICATADEATSNRRADDARPFHLIVGVSATQISGVFDLNMTQILTSMVQQSISNATDAGRKKKR
jgi:hypothetical protein